ncbi:SDR family oxidoreductase [soil metagenome]
MGDLDGKVAIVTGASRGIGRAIAECLARDGAAVAINYARSADKAVEVVSAIEDGGGKAFAVQADMGEVADIQNLFGETIDRFGKLDILVNNAGISVFKPHAEVTEEEFDKVFGLNARDTFFSLREAAKTVEDGGRIVSISTGGTTQSVPGGGIYSGSKAPVEQFSMALAKELGERGITVNTVLPGVTDTDGLIMPEDQKEQLIGQTPLGRLGRPEDIADVVAFLVSEEARWITSQNIRVGGGVV